MKSIRPDELSEAILGIVKEYRQDVADGLKREVKEVGRDCRDDIRDHSPRESGEYADSWSDHVAFERADDIRIIVYNRKHYRRTHLLENGHLKAGGGRVNGRAHIRPAEQRAAERLLNRAKVVVRQG